LPKNEKIKNEIIANKKEDLHMQNRRKLLYTTSLLFLSLVACNNMGNNALDTRIIDEDFLQLQQATFDTFPSEDEQGQLSSESTTVPSGKFPHTRAIQVQPARYEFVIVDDQQKASPQGKFERQPETTPEQPEGISDVEARVIELTNAERRRNGMSDLQVDSPLGLVAQEKSSDMRKNNYFSHTSPIYGSPFDMIRDFGVSYSAAGENIAKGQRSAEQVVQAWMDSEGHRANILNGTFTHIGVGYIENGNYWTQMFISR
jgi:uncharacterized YkwD family protein